MSSAAGAWNRGSDVHSTAVPGDTARDHLCGPEPPLASSFGPWIQPVRSWSVGEDPHEPGDLLEVTVEGDEFRAVLHALGGDPYVIRWDKRPLLTKR